MSQLCFTIRSAKLSPLEGLREGVRKGHPYVLIEYEEWEALKPCIDAIHTRTGKFIDYYSWEEFEGDELDVVAAEFQALKREVNASPESIGISAHLSSILQRSLELIGVAKIDGKVFVCKGP